MTILFESCWDHHPGAIVDYNTKNQDFVRLASLYREMGVKNHGMILALHNKELKGVDPFNPPDKDHAEAIAIECKENFWYFIREIARDPQGSDDFPLMFIPNRGIIAAYWLYFNHILFILIMIRQTGKSFGIDWLITWLMNFGLTDSEINQITRNEQLRSRELMRLKDMELALPPYLKQRSPKDPGNTELLRISSLNNTFRSFVPNPSIKMADSVGRGMTSANAFGDELAYLINNFITINVMLSATQAAREVSRRKGEPYGTVFSTTTGKRNTPEGSYAYKLVSEAAPWSEEFMNLRSTEELIRVLIGICGNARVNCTFNHRQLGKDDQWLANRLKEALLDDANDPNAKVQIEADYLNLWPAGSELTPFPQDIAKAIQASEVLDYYTEITKDFYTFRWYYPQDKLEWMLMQEEHILSIDSSDAIGRDSIAVFLGSVRSGETAMVAEIPRTNIIVFCRWLADFLEKFLKVTLIIELKSTGRSIVDYLLLYLPIKGIDPFRRIYNLCVQEATVYPQRFQEIQQIHVNPDALLIKFKEFFGWVTTGSGATARSKLYTETLMNAGRNIGYVVKDRPLILQLLGLVIKNQRIDHRDGEHDDLCIAWLLFYWLLSSGKNLQYYGIDPSIIMSQNVKLIEQKKVTSAYQSYLQRRARTDVQRLSEEIENEKDPMVAKRLEMDLEYALKNLSEEDKVHFSADDFINTLREKKRKAMQIPGLDLKPGEPMYLSWNNRQFSSGPVVYRG